jgi:hypothetical protein
MASAGIVIVVFDEPAVLTDAKREEQARRDATRKKKEPLYSEDLSPHPTNDCYSLAELMATTNCHAIVGCRAARNRFFDETGKYILDTLSRSISKWAENGDESIVIFDGLDPRGAGRGIGEKREPQIFGSDPATAALFQRAVPIGEGDLKLAWAEQRVRDLVATGDLKTRLHMSCTIDTDIIATSLIDHGRRCCAPGVKTEGGVMGVLCMRERTQKRDDCDSDTNAVYWAVDYSRLYQMLQLHMWSIKDVNLLPSAEQQRRAIALLVGGWVLAGSDFVQVKSLQARLVIDAMPGILKTAPHLLALMSKSWSGDADEVKRVTPALRRLVHLCAANYGDERRSRQTSVTNMRDHSEDQLLRAAWVLSYWSGNEITVNLHEFGFSCVTLSRGAMIMDGRALASSSDFFAPSKKVAESTKDPSESEGPLGIFSEFAFAK